VSDALPPIGTLTDRVELKRRTMTDEDEGGEIALFTPLATVWARVRTLSARQAAQSEALGATLTHSVVLRFRSDIGPGDRIGYRGRDLDVISAADLNGGKAYLSCQCSERAVTG
jgi:SPP1 family predicted phage head-tail adaptor